MEIRKDYFLERWVIIAEDRGKRPSDLGSVSTNKKNTTCPFCKGRENQTPPEICRIGNENWNARVIPNKFPAVTLQSEKNVQTHNKYYTFSGNYGVHEVIIESPKHISNFGELTIEEIKNLISLYTQRINEINSNPSISYSMLFKNQGKEAGASLDHIHSQIISTSILPTLIKDKLNKIKELNYCPYCEIIEKEKNSYRHCFENDSFVAFTPYASRFGYEIWIMPKRHLTSFEEINKISSDLAAIIKLITNKLESVNIPFNIDWFYSPDKENLHFHIEVTPRVSNWAGYEFGTRMIINSINPENAARFYRGEL